MHGGGAHPPGRRAPRADVRGRPTSSTRTSRPTRWCSSSRELAEQLRELGDAFAPTRSSRASSRRGRTRCARCATGASSSRRGENVIKLGRHRFSVNTQPLELMLVPRDGEMALHLTGTDFFEAIGRPGVRGDAGLLGPADRARRPTDVYRGEYLAACMLARRRGGQRAGLTLEAPTTRGDRPTEPARRWCARTPARLRRGLRARHPRRRRGRDPREARSRSRSSAGLLRFSPTPRALAAPVLGLRSTMTSRRCVLRHCARGASAGCVLASRTRAAQAALARRARGADRASVSNEHRPARCVADDARAAGALPRRGARAESPRASSPARRPSPARRRSLRSSTTAEPARVRGRPARARGALGPVRVSVAAWLEAFVARTTDARARADRSSASRPRCMLAHRAEGRARRPSALDDARRSTGSSASTRASRDRTMRFALDEFLARLTFRSSRESRRASARFASRQGADPRARAQAAAPRRVHAARADARSCATG